MTLSSRADGLARLIAGAVFTGGQGEMLAAEPAMAALAQETRALREAGRSMFIIGNGGSAAIASHIVNDLVNMARLRALTLHDSSLFSCMANDYGYDNAFARILDTMAAAGDMLVAISSSGRSANIRNAAALARAKGCRVVTLTGFAADNPLRVQGDLNIWVDADDYGMVENAHTFILHNLADRFRYGQV